MSDTTMPAPVKQIADIVMYQDPIKELERIEQENENLVFDYEKDEPQVRSHIHSLRKVKGNIERERKSLKAGALEFGRRVDGAAKELAARVERIISIHQEPLDAIARREEERKQKIQDAMDRLMPDTEGVTTSAQARQLIDTIEAIEIDADVYQERMAEAVKLKQAQRDFLWQMFTRLKKQEDEAAELARLRKEQEERDRKEREERIAQEAAARAKREAEAEAERKAKAEREAAARREAELKAQAEREKREAEEAHREAQEEAARKFKEAEEKAAREKAEAIRKEQEAKAAEEKRLADQKHVASINRQAMADLQAACELPEDQAKAVIVAICKGKVSNVTIKY